jgi:hypothetical protein
MYCVKYLDPLRGKLGFFTEGNSEGSREQAKAAKILADTCLDFLQKATKRTKIFAAAEDKAFVFFVVFCLERIRRSERCAS